MTTHKTRGRATSGSCSAPRDGLLWRVWTQTGSAVQEGWTRYLCNFLRQKYRVPVCQHIPGDAVDPSIVEAFFQALSSIELDVYSRAVAAKQETINQICSCPSPAPLSSPV